MDARILTRKFDLLGARLALGPLRRRRGNSTDRSVIIDVARDGLGEYFDLQVGDKAELEVLDIQPGMRHLVLMSRQPASTRRGGETKDKFLCGHDERHWFVAALPEQAPVSSVVTAMESLKPALVRGLERGVKGKRAKRLRRKTAEFIRQGEWFFISVKNVPVDDRLVLQNEPLRRGGGKPHICEFLFRDLGTAVFVSRQYPNGLAGEQYRALVQRNPEAARWNWQSMRRDPVVYVRGSISHPDHATIHLNEWRRVLMNTENQSRARAQVAFLD